MEGPDVDIPALIPVVEALFPYKDGPEVVKKQAARLILEKGARQGFQLRLHVLGHLLNTRLGRAWRHQYGVGVVPLSQFFTSDAGIFEVVPTDIQDVSAVRLNLAVLQASTASTGKVRVVPRPVATAHSNHSSPKIPGPATPSPATAALNAASRSSPDTPLSGTATAAAGASSSSAACSSEVHKARPVSYGSPRSAAGQVGEVGSSIGAGSSSSREPSSAAAGRASSSTPAGYGKGVEATTVMAFVKVVKWKEASPNVNMLRQCLAASMVRRACDGTGRLPPDVLQYTIEAEDAAAILKRAWTGRFPDQQYPYPSLQHVLSGDKYLKLMPATANSSGQRVRLLLKLLLQRMQGIGTDSTDAASAACLHRAANTVVLSPSAAASAVPATLPAILPAKLTAKNAGTAAAGGQLAGRVQHAAAAPKGDDDMLAASAAAAEQENMILQLRSSMRSNDMHSTTPRHTTSASALAGDADMMDASAAAAATPYVPKKVVLTFIQKWRFDQNVDYNLMKKALATFLVNRAAGQHAQEVPVDMKKTHIHVAQAGDVFHKVWVNRHAGVEKSYRSMFQVIGNDAFFTIEDGPKHARQIVQLNIVKLAAAATEAAADETVQPGNTDHGIVLPASPLIGGCSTSRSSVMDGFATARSGNRNSNHCAAAAATDAVAAATQAVALRVAQGCLLAVDLLGFAQQIITWDAHNEGLNLLRQQLAMRIIAGAHLGLAAAVAAGEQVLADSCEERYVMSPYAAGNALMEIWCQLRPGEPRPYTTLPSAIAGDRYLHLKIGALGGNQLQLDIAQMIADCTASMKDLRGEWAVVAAAGAAAVAGTASGTQAAAAGGEVSRTDGVINGLQQSHKQQSAASLLHSLVPEGAAVQNGLGQHTLYDTATVEGMCSLPVQPQQLQNGYRSSTDHNNLGPNLGLTAGDLGDLGGEASAAVVGSTLAVQQSPQLPSMSRLLEILRHAPPEICEAASVVLVPEGVQGLLFSGNENDTVDQLLHLANGVGATYAARNIRIILDLAGVNDLLDHLLACTMMCLGVTCSSSSGGSGGDQQEMLLLQILAPPVVTQSGAVVDGAVYVFEIRQLQQQQQQHSAQGESGAIGVTENQLANLMSILLEDANIVKLVEDSSQVASLMHCYFNISVQGMLDARSLQEHLAAGGLLLGQYGDLPQALRNHLDAYQRAAGQVSGSKLMLRRLPSSTSRHPLPAECIAGAAAAVRPLVSLVHNAVELLPLAMMRRC